MGNITICTQYRHEFRFIRDILIEKKDELKLSLSLINKICNALMRARICCVGDVLSKTDQQLLKIPGVGKGTLLLLRKICDYNDEALVPKSITSNRGR